MSRVADDIINGAYGKNKKKDEESIADSIINGTYAQKKSIAFQENQSSSIKNTKSESGNSFNNDSVSMWDRIKQTASYMTKKTGLGIWSGVTGIGQAGLTDLANSANKGKNTNFFDIIKNVSNPITMNPIEMGIDSIKTLANKDKNPLQKVVDLGLNATSNANNMLPFKNTINTVTQLAGKVAPNLEHNFLEVNKAISNPIQKRQEELEKEAENYGAITKTLGDVGQSVGNMIPSIATTIATKNPSFGLATMGISAKGQSTQEALNKGADLDTAIKIGDTKGMIEIGTEMLTGGVNIFGKGALDDIVEKGIIKKVKNNVAKKLTEKGIIKKVKNKGFDIGGEILEETISDVLGTAIDKGTVDPNAKYTLEDWGETALQTTLTTFALNALTGGLTGGINTVKNIKNNNTKQNSNNELINKANQLNEISEQTKASESLKQEIKNSNLSNEDKTNMINYVNNNSIDYDNMKQTIDNANKSISESKRLYNESASKYNIDTNNNIVQSIQELAERRGIQAKYDADVFNSSNEEAIWTQKEDGSREIVINPNADSNKTLQNIAVHELFHDFEGTREKSILTEMALEKMKVQEGYEDAMKSLTETYAQRYDRNSADFNKLINEEASAKFLGENLGNQEFIDDLVSKQNRSTVQKVYDWVVDKVELLKNRLTGDVEAEYWRKVKNNFEKAFSKEYEGNDGVSIKNSIQTDASGNKYVRVDTDQDIFDGIDKKDYSKIAKMYIQDYLLGETTLANNDTAIIDKKGANKYTNPGKRQQNFDKKMQLTPELKNVLEVAQKDKISLPSKDNSKYQSWEYYKFNFELSGKKFEGTINIGIDSNKNKHFYEINKIKEVDDILGTSLNRSSASFNNSILPTKDFVNRNTNKYSMQESENNSRDNTFDKFVEQNSINKGTGETIQQVKLPDLLPKKNIENNKEMLYNNFNERESDINGYTRNINERGNGIYEKSTKEQREFTWEEYNKWEQSIKPITGNNITTKERQSINKSKQEHNKDVYLFDENNNDNRYAGGASQTAPNRINISKQQAEYFGLDNMIEHETVESDIMHNDSANDILTPVIKLIKEDPAFEKQKNEFWKDQEGEMPKDDLIAKDILCDRFAEIRNKTKMKYNNILNNATNSTIDNALQNYYYQVYGKELEFSSSNILPENQSLDALTNDINKQEIAKLPESKNPTRHDVVQSNREIARENIKNIANWKDKSSGIKYQLETMERNMYDIIPDKKEAKKIVDTYFEPVHELEAEKQRFINKYNDRIKEFNLNKYESEAVQVLGEKKYNPSFKINEVDNQNKTILDKVNENIKKGKINEQKVNEAIEVFRNIYDELFEIENKVLKENGYKEKPYRKGYFPHFIDYVPETKTEKILNKLGFNIDKRSLPTDISGITEQFVPGKTWNKSALERKTEKTDYNALKGFDTYIAQASDNIFHTENIQKLRGLENEIRYQYSEKGVQERIDNILNDESLYQEEKQVLIDEIFKQVNNPMPNLVVELRRYTNALANKKSEADRSMEQSAGRSVYSTINAIENRFGANAVGLNIGSAITNFIPITQAYSQVSTKNMGRAIIDTVKSYVQNDSFVDKSTFLTNRLNQSEKLYQTTLDKISKKTSFLFDAIDEVTSNIVVRGKYLENLQKGMSESEAIKNADRFAANVIADRSKGALPTKFEEKNPLTKMFTQFQLEVNNQYRYMFKDIPRDLGEKGLGAIALAFFKMFVGAWLYNEASEKLTGRKPAFSPIDLVKSSYDTITDKDLSTYDKMVNIGKEVGEQLPFVGGLIGGGRVPVDGAIPNVGNVTKSLVGLATGEMDSAKAKDTLKKEFSKPLYYLLPPFGGGQIRKSAEGIKAVSNGGSYGLDSKGQEVLQFPVENPTVKDYVKAGIFGKYALPEAKTYTDTGYKSLNAKDTKGYKEVKLPYKEFITYTNNSELKKKEEKIDFINKMNITDQQRWDMYCYDIFSSETREKDKCSQLDDAKYAIANGTTKSEYLNLYQQANIREMTMPIKGETEQLKREGISLNNYMDYKIKVHDETKKQKERGQLTETQTLKNKDKIEILLNSKCSNKEKEALYKNSINQEDKKIILVDELNFPITEYLKYKQQDFKNDKDENGESVSGTKKQKVADYLVKNNNLTFEQKLLICKLEGLSKVSGVDNLDSSVVRIVDKANISGVKKEEILKVLGYNVDKYGNVKSTIMLPMKKSVK